MSYAGFQRCLAVTWLPANDGQPYHVTPGDAGGPTAWGVTLAVFVAWRAKHGQPSATADDLAAATQDDLADIYHADFWCAVQGDHLPVGVDLIAFETAVGSGPGWAARLLKRALGVAEDFRMDTATVRTAQAQNAASLVRRYNAAHLAYVDSLGDARKFRGGWDRRIEADGVTALGWIGAA